MSAADLASERFIRRRLREARPYDALMGEEGDDFEPDEPSGLLWVIDPLDGTTNFLYGIPEWAVSIAVLDADGRSLAGAVYDPARDELWSASCDGDATVDGVTIRGSQRADLATALVATGFGYDAAVRKAQAAVVAELLGQVRDIRRLGSAALDLAWTAAGRYDAFFERGINLWDIAAGQLICERAGLAASQLAPAPPLPGGIVVASRELLGPLEALL